MPDERPDAPNDVPNDADTASDGVGDGMSDGVDVARIHAAARRQFGRVAAAYVTSAVHAQGAELADIVALSGPLEGRAALDVATGGGHTALALAQAGARVTATDLSETMLGVARDFLAAQGVVDVRFIAAPAEALPFPDGVFAVVTCRIAAHHFAAPAAFVRAAARVLVSGGRLVVVDNVAPDAPDLADAMNAVERLRDPSHVTAYPVSAWVGWLLESGFRITHLRRFRRVKDFAVWTENAGLDTEGVQALTRYIAALPEAARAYLGVAEEGGRVVALAHEVTLVVGELASHNPGHDIPRSFA